MKLVQIGLEDTIGLMVSEDYKLRFKAEYYQTLIRLKKLRRFTAKIEAAHTQPNIVEPKHDCPLSLLNEQKCAMEKYLRLLEIRAEIENIEL